MTILRVCYQHGVRFDEAYYVTKHLPLVASVFGPHGLKNIEMMKVVATPDGSASRYGVIFSAYFESPTGLRNARQSPRMADVIADIRNYFDGTPEVLIGDLVSLPTPA